MSQMRPKLNHLDWFLAHSRAADLLPLFPNAKEVTESVAAYRAVQRSAAYRLSDRNVSVAVIADGHTPRTAALFALSTAWQARSIDPALSRYAARSRPIIDRLHVLPYRIEDLPPCLCGPADDIVAVHSHAPLSEAVRRLAGRRTLVVSMPCCFPDDLPWPPTESYRDAACLCQHNVINLYSSSETSA